LSASIELSTAHLWLMHEESKEYIGTYLYRRSMVWLFIAYSYIELTQTDLCKNKKPRLALG